MGKSKFSMVKKNINLKTGDSIYYDSIIPHELHASNGIKAKILAVIYAPI